MKGTKLLWILLAIVLFSQVSWSNAFTPGAGMKYGGKRGLPSNEKVRVEMFISFLMGL